MSLRGEGGPLLFSIFFLGQDYGPSQDILCRAEINFIRSRLSKGKSNQNSEHCSQDETSSPSFGLQATTQFSCSCSLSPVAGVTLLFFIFPSRQPLPRALVKMSALLKVQTKKSREGSEMPKLPFSASLSILLFPWKIDSINKNLFWEHLPGLKI